jgi:SPP1 gp7 family putative phage head morphogenesis protein
MAAKPKTARGVRPNRGVEARYRKELQVMVADMARSAEYWLVAQYKKSEPVAMDALPAADMAERLKEVSSRWIGKFNDMSAKISKMFADGARKSTDHAFQQSLKDAGWAVEFKMTRAMQDVMKASVVENVSLIKSIPQQYFTQVEGIVMRGFQRGRDLHYITEELKKRYDITDRRAAFIANDQCNKLTAAVTKARRQELGITEAIWQHSHAGREPRKSHVAADGKKFKIAEGCLIDGKYIQPGEEINCRCTSKSVLPF